MKPTFHHGIMLFALSTIFAMPAIAQKNAPEHEAACLHSSIGKTVTLHGTAEDSKGGAGVLVDNNEFVYVEELSSWPSDVRGKQVVVTGLLHHRKFIPDPVVGPTGEISQGAEGMQYTVEKAKWRRVDPPTTSKKARWKVEE